jgi:hypothetical protein
VLYQLSHCPTDGVGACLSMVAVNHPRREHT